MTRKISLLATLVLTFSAVSLHAQGFGGCVNSPENPTLILAGLASGAFAVSSFRTRLRVRRGAGKARK